MTFLHEEALNSLSVQCPPKDYKPSNIDAYRWVYNDINNPENFKPVYYRNPKRTSSADDAGKCNLMALSMFDTCDNAKRRFLFLKTQMGSSIYKTLGTKIAFANITDNDGVNGRVDNKGHFNHHPYKNCNYESRFVIVEELV